MDNCCFNRPYDDQSSLKVYLQTQAKLEIQDMIRVGRLDLIWSSIEDYENAQNPYELRRFAISQWRDLAVKIQKADQNVTEKAKQIMKKGIKNKDALHIASAIIANADVFITVDKKILRTQIDEIKILSPVEFLFYEETSYDTNT